MPRVTVRDIAKAVGCHYTTVAAALRNSPKVAEATKKKVMETAERLGYRPDPYLSALNSYKRNADTPAFKAIIAWIDNYPRFHGVRQFTTFEEYFQGAKARAEELGYQLEEFWAGNPEIRMPRLVSMLKARNIQGVLLAPQPRYGTHYDFEWDQFSVVTFGYSIASPKLTTISNHQYGSTLILHRKLTELGYRRIGLHLLRSHDERLEHAYSGAYLALEARKPKKDRLSPLFEDVHEFEAFRDWLKKEKPEAIITNTDHLHQWTERLKLRIPEDIAITMLTVPRNERFYAGIHQNGITTGRTAVEIVDGMVRRGQSGLPEKPMKVLIDGEWQNGPSVVQPASR